MFRVESSILTPQERITEYARMITQRFIDETSSIEAYTTKYIKQNTSEILRSKDIVDGIKIYVVAVAYEDYEVAHMLFEVIDSAAKTLAMSNVLYDYFLIESQRLANNNPDLHVWRKYIIESGQVLYFIKNAVIHAKIKYCIKQHNTSIIVNDASLSYASYRTAVSYLCFDDGNYYEMIFRTDNDAVEYFNLIHDVKTDMNRYKTHDLLIGVKSGNTITWV